MANTQPLLAAGLAWLVLDEGQGPVQRLGLGARFGGIVLIAVPGMAGGTAAVFVLRFVLLERARLTQLNVFTFLTPIFGLVMGSAFFAERVTPTAMAGIALSLAGIYLVSRRPARRPGG